jgi:hypothetical protein
VAVLLAAFVVGAGLGGYLIGSSSNMDVDAARLAAAAKGREAGAELGARKGYAEGFRSARGRSYRSVYAASYRQAYAEEFKSAGLDPPRSIHVPARRRG